MKGARAANRRDLWKVAYSARRAESYDRLIREGVGPIYQTTLSAVEDVLRLLAPRKPLRILDLGTGTGNLLGKLMTGGVAASAVGVDGSVHMLEIARRRFRDAPAASFLERDFGSRGWMKGLGTFDAVVSTGAIHHLDGKGKRNLFRELRSLLRAGGAFVCGDPLKGASPRLDRMYEDAWVDLIRRNTARLSGRSLSRGVIRSRHRAIQKREGDDPSRLDDQLGWLKHAGFRDVDCYWKHFGFAVFGGRKAAA
jgi:tRNA (cmo5U34)-methyltransferase